MSILIKGIDMPKGCDETCPLYLAGQCCEGCDCPLIEIDIVRCGECKWFAEEGNYCANNILVQFDHFFCYYGERRTDDKTEESRP